MAKVSFRITMIDPKVEHDLIKMLVQLNKGKSWLST